MQLDAGTADKAIAFVGHISGIGKMKAEKFPKLYSMEENGCHGSIRISDDEALNLIRALLEENSGLMDDNDWLTEYSGRLLLEDPWDE